ncbi:MAG: class I SAM-dependent methyltransferase [Verrucomicrobiaceae bacterium]
MKRATHLAHDLLKEVVGRGDAVIDATAGNGHDSLFLAELVGEEGEVHAFDIQEAALDATRSRLEEARRGDCLKTYLESHAKLAGMVPSAKAVMFNLGYLPGADQGVITRSDSTLEALEGAVEILEPGGVITCVCYPGHPGGLDEAEAVLGWAESCGERGEVILANEKDRHEGRPFLVGFRNVREIRG